MKDFHHYKGDNLTPAEKVERRLVELVLESPVSDSERESSKIWEIKHSAGCCQIARILAYKRGLDLTISETAALLHDMSVAVNGSYDNHAEMSSKLAGQLLIETGGFTDEQIAQIVTAIAQHSQKEIYSDDPYVELVKDADVLDCSLYRSAEDYYRIHKSPELVAQYIKRSVAVRKELGFPTEEAFRP